MTETLPHTIGGFFENEFFHNSAHHKVRLIKASGRVILNE